MREILFRGKRVDNGEWVQGFYFEQYGDCAVIPCISESPLCANDYSDILGNYAEIIPETVGQFTGLTDKNGTKIFEGDIVKEKDCVHNGEIQIKGNVFKIRFLDNGIFCADNGGWWEFIDEIGDIEVIGNIHDNPELLEAQQ